LGHGLAAAEKQSAEEKIACEQKWNGATHWLDRHFLSQLCAACKQSNRVNGEALHRCKALVNSSR